jgi:MFS family permease
MYSVAIGFWVYQETGSSTLMGIMSAISMFVSMFLSPFSGSIVDKCNRKWVMVGVDTLQGILMLVMGVLAYLEILNVPGVLLVAFLAAFGSVFYSPAVSTLMIDIIPKDQMVQGQSLFSGVSTLINLVGTALSGLVVAFLGVPLIVVCNGLSNLYSALSECFIRVPKTAQQGETVTVRSVLSDSGKAIREILTDRFLKHFVPLSLIINLLAAGALALVLPLCMEKGFTVEQYGYLMAVWTAASLLCVLLLGVVKLSPRGRFLTLAVGFGSCGLFFILTYLSTAFVPMCIAAFFASLTNCAGNSVFNAAMMLALPEKNRGAILGFMQSASVGGTALSTLVYGLLGEIYPLWAVFTAGCVLSLIPMLWLALHPKTREFVLNH